MVRFTLSLLVLLAALAPPTIGRSESTDSGNLAVECSVAGYHIMPAFVGVHLALEHAGKVVVEKTDPAGNFELAFLSSGCALQNFLPAGTTKRPMTLVSVTAQGDVMYDAGSGGQSLFVKQAGKAPVPLAPPSNFAGRFWKVTLSDDGSSVVWTESAGHGGEQLRVRDLAGGAEKTIPLTVSAGMNLEVLAADISKDRYVLRNFPKTIVGVNSHGAAIWGPRETGVVRTVLTSENLRRVGDGWIAWDASSDAGTVRMEWSTPAGSGQHEFPQLRIESVSVTPDASRIAVSASSSSEASDNETVLILSVSNGKELFRRTMPHHSRIRLGFLDDTHLAMNTSDGVDVVRLPAAMQALEAGAIAKPVDVEEQAQKHATELATMFGLEVKKPSPDSKRALVGTWGLEDLGHNRGCAPEDPILEVQEDGVAIDPTAKSRMGSVEVGENSITVGEPGSPAKLTIFAMSGGFYVPSEKCKLLKMVRYEDE